MFEKGTLTVIHKLTAVADQRMHEWQQTVETIQHQRGVGTGHRTQFADLRIEAGQLTVQAINGCSTAEHIADIGRHVRILGDGKLGPDIIDSTIQFKLGNSCRIGPALDRIDQAFHSGLCAETDDIGVGPPVERQIGHNRPVLPGKMRQHAGCQKAGRHQNTNDYPHRGYSSSLSKRDASGRFCRSDTSNAFDLNGESQRACQF